MTQNIAALQMGQEFPTKSLTSYGVFLARKDFIDNSIPNGEIFSCYATYRIAMIFTKNLLP